MIMRRVALPVVALSVAVAQAACRPGGAQEVPAPEPVPVRVAPVTQETVTPSIAATGTLGPKEEIALSFKVGGIVESVAVDAGRSVAAGAVLARLDLREIDAAVTRARSAAEKAERDLARARRLYADSVVTLVQLQDAETGAEVARADLAAAQFNRRYAVITAPSSGVILRRSTEPGELVSPGTTVLVLGSRSRGSVVRAGLADRDVVRVRRGDSASVRFDAWPDREWKGRVTEIAAAADPGTGTYQVEVALGDVAGLSAGMVGRVEIAPSSGVRASVIPIEALLEADGDEATVYALAGDGRRAERRRVTVAWLVGDRVAVTNGLEGVSAVLTAGAAYVENGGLVQVVR